VAASWEAYLFTAIRYQVAVDQADGTNRLMANDNTLISAINGLTLEGQGVSPVASVKLAQMC
jgi:hypothetical protein